MIACTDSGLEQKGEITCMQGQRGVCHMLRTGPRERFSSDYQKQVFSSVFWNILHEQNLQIFKGYNMFQHIFYLKNVIIQGFYLAILMGLRATNIGNS